LLDNLGTLMLEAAGALQQPVAASGRDDSIGIYNVYIKAQYVALRAKQGKKRSAGYSVVLGSLLDHVGAQTVLWFHLKLNPTKHKRLELSALEEALKEKLGVGAQSIGDGLWLYIRTSSQSGTNLDLDALSQEAQRLPEVFAFADPWITTRYPA